MLSSFLLTVYFLRIPLSQQETQYVVATIAVSLARVWIMSLLSSQSLLHYGGFVTLFSADNL